MRVDTSNLGYKYYGHGSRRSHALQWVGCVETDDGEQGALAFNPLTGFYLCFRHGRSQELDTMQVLQALAEPVRFNPPGRRASGKTAARVCTVTINDDVHDAAKNMGNGNLSLGFRLAVEYVFAYHGADFTSWRDGKTATDERR